MGYLKKKELIIESRYKVIKKLGSSKYATTYKVKDIRTAKVYVLKLYNGLTIQKFYQYFDPESMEKAVSINFMGITDIYDFGVHNGKIFFVREAFSPESLKKLKFDNINLSQFYSILGQILSVIVFLDSQNFNPSNLKLSNILFKFKEKDSIHIKVTDYFYIGPENRFEMDANSFYYVAPETIEKNEITLQSNFYSLGVILYKIITGNFPYTYGDIKSFVTNRTLKIVKSPTEYKPFIPEKLSNFILRLIKLNPEDRFTSAEDLLEELNGIQERDFSYILNSNLKAYINYHDYYVDEDISHMLTEHIAKITSHDIDNIIVLYGQKGIRKDRTISLFRYHIFNESNLIFDYQCSKEKHDPFFSLCIEFFNSGLIDKKEWEKAEPEISDRFREFISKSGNEIEVKEDEEKIKTDFVYVTRFLMFVARKDRPLIFVIRNAEFLTPSTLNFLNFLISYKNDKDRFSTSPIMIVLSTNNVNKFYVLKQSSTSFIHSKPMNYDKTKEYMKQLLKNITPPDSLVEKVWYYTYGNPLFIKNLLLQLVRKKLIWEEDNRIFTKKLTDIKTPNIILSSVKYRLSNIPKEYAKYLEKLAWLDVKFTIDMMYKILRFKKAKKIMKGEDITFIDLMLDNDFIERVDDIHYKIVPGFLYNFLKKYLTKEEKCEISQRFFDYALSNNLNITFNVIEKHLNFVKKYELKEQILNTIGNRLIREKNFKLYLKVLFNHLKIAHKTDAVSLEEKKKIALRLILNNEYNFFEDLLTEINLFFEKSKRIPYYKNINLGMYYYKTNQYKNAMKHYKRASKLAETNEEKFVVQLFISYIVNKMENSSETELKKLFGYNKKQDMLKKGVAKKLNSPFSVYYALKLARKKILELLDKNKDAKALSILDKLFKTKTPANHLEFFVFMEYYNFLGIIYSNKRMTNIALDYYSKALKIAKEYNILYYIILIENNIADTYLFMGKPEQVFSYIGQSVRLCGNNLCITGMIQSLVNIAEAFIKMGKFAQAMNSLAEAKRITETLPNKPFIMNILNNLSLIKIKINNFNYYLSHIKENFPMLLKGKIKSINPTVKTFFYFLNQVGDYESIELLLKNNKKVFDDEQEFFYRAKSFLVMNKIKNKNYTETDKDDALNILKKNIESSKNIQSKYAETITLINLAEYYLLFGNLEDAVHTINLALENCYTYKYEYWQNQANIVKILIDLQNPEIDLRKILGDLFNSEEYFRGNNIFYSEIIMYHLAVLITSFMKQDEAAKKYFNIYKTKVNNAIDGLISKYKNKFLEKFPLDYKELIQKSTVKIVNRKKLIYENFAFEAFPLLNNKNFEDRNDKLAIILKKYIRFDHFAIFKSSNGYKLKEYINFDFDENVLKNEDLKEKIIKAIENDEIVLFDNGYNKITIIPVAVNYNKFGVILGYDNLLFPLFTQEDISNFNIIRIQLAAFFKYSEDYYKVILREKNVKKLLEIFEESVLYKDIESLEERILEKLSELLNAKRGFIFKSGEETMYYSQDINNEKSEHTGINLNLIEKYLNIYENTYKYINKNKPGTSNSIFVLRLYFKEFDYKAIYYFDNFNGNKELVEFDKVFMKMLINIIATTIGIVHKNKITKLLKKRIEDFREEKIYFLKLISHEFNTQQSKIFYALNRLSKVTQNNSDLNALKLSYQRLKYLIDAVNKYYYFKEEYQPQYGKYNLKNVIVSVVEEIDKKTKEAGRNMIFEKEIQDELNQEYLIDKDALREVLIILLTNAVRFSKENSKIIVGGRMALFEKERIGEDTFVLFVKDFGKGIDPSQKDKIYNVVYEAKDVNSHKSGDLDFDSGSLGLGLSIAKNIVEKLNGKIYHISEKGKETTFFVNIPMITEK